MDCTALWTKDISEVPTDEAEFFAENFLPTALDPEDTCKLMIKYLQRSQTSGVCFIRDKMSCILGEHPDYCTIVFNYKG